MEIIENEKKNEISQIQGDWSEFKKYKEEAQRYIVELNKTKQNKQVTERKINMLKIKQRNGTATKHELIQLSSLEGELPKLKRQIANLESKVKKYDRLADAARPRTLGSDIKDEFDIEDISSNVEPKENDSLVSKIQEARKGTLEMYENRHFNEHKGELITESELNAGDGRTFTGGGFWCSTSCKRSQTSINSWGNYMH